MLLSNSHYYLVYCEAVRSAILAIAWFLVCCTYIQEIDMVVVCADIQVNRRRKVRSSDAVPVVV